MQTETFVSIDTKNASAHHEYPTHAEVMSIFSVKENLTNVKLSSHYFPVLISLTQFYQ